MSDMKRCNKRNRQHLTENGSKETEACLQNQVPGKHQDKVDGTDAIVNSHDSRPSKRRKRNTSNMVEDEEKAQAPNVTTRQTDEQVQVHLLELSKQLSAFFLTTGRRRSREFRKGNKRFKATA